MTGSLASDQHDREVLAGIVEPVTFHNAETVELTSNLHFGRRS
jgi:hypothetical protein